MLKQIAGALLGGLAVYEGVQLAKNVKRTDGESYPMFKEAMTKSCVVVGAVALYPIAAPMGAYRLFSNRKTIAADAQETIDNAKVWLAEQRVKAAMRAAERAANKADAAIDNVIVANETLRSKVA